MPAIAPSKLLLMSREKDPKEAIYNALAGAVDRFAVMRNQVLVGTFIEAEMTSGGIIKPQKSQQECLYQGTTGLVLKLGPKAFQHTDWSGERVELGQWAVFRYSSAWEFHLNGVSVRLVDDVDIRGVIEDPRWLEGKPIMALGG